jgi:hypothetical protein
MRIRFGDTGEVYRITGERRQFWLFDKNGAPGKAVKGSDAYEILDGDGTLPEIEARWGITIRDEVEGLDEVEESEEEWHDVDSEDDPDDPDDAYFDNELPENLDIE